MARITLQVLEGLERGTTFRDLPTPVSIGREEENTVRLNDERVSRFHAKVQEDGERVILTDLDSTNGTRVNGRPISARVLRPGDQIALGRCLLTYGGREELDRLTSAARERRAAETAGVGGNPEDTRGRTAGNAPGPGRGEVVEDVPGVPPFLPPGERPPVPQDLDLAQQAQLCDLLGFAHEELRGVLLEAVEADFRSLPLPDRVPNAAPDLAASRPRRSEPLSPEETPSDGGSPGGAGGSGLPGRDGKPDGGDAHGEPPRIVSWDAWQRLARLEMALAEMLKAAAEPH
ncbi:FHA domain-containing protein [Alienimonas sp. DA493]|uniref:FHA domain-containing protein n=1 Tax=Alienimonas sp. DA493 TaxID=3373605 RepID=UPI0037545600